MTRPRRPSWDFDYRPIVSRAGGDGGPCDVVVATRVQAPVQRLHAAFEAAGAAVAIDEALDLGPIHWVRVRGPATLDPARAAEIAGSIAEVRYVAPADHGTQAWAPPLELDASDRARASAWRAREATRAEERFDGGRWFLAAEGGGVAAIHEVTGTGVGARVAVIDDDAAGADALDLDAEVLVGLERRPSAQSHGASMVAWAVGAPRAEPPFRGVAPDASPRLYLVPKPGSDVLSLPIAIVRAVADGADAIVCATYVEGTWSPMLDDALAYAERAGRGGLGAVVVLPTGRETSSPAGSVHASLTLSFGDPAADPRVVCVAPGSRSGGWFFYRDRKKLARPFANRGPSVRLLAPGDDIAHPLGGPPRLSHAESSGASAIACGAVALVLASNPSLRLRELLLLLEMTATPVDATPDPAWMPFADAYDTLPHAKDRDGHNAKHGHGALSAARACLAARDPVAWALVRIGEDQAAARYAAIRRVDPEVRGAYSDELGRHLVRVLMADARASHAARALVRHARLLSGDRRRLASSPPGALVKQLAILLRALLEDSPLAAELALRAEIEAKLAELQARHCGPAVRAEPPGDDRLDAQGLEPRVVALADRIFGTDLPSGVSNGNDSA